MFEYGVLPLRTFYCVLPLCTFDDYRVLPPRPRSTTVRASLTLFSEHVQLEGFNGRSLLSIGVFGLWVA
jgi:hypothetical protein